MPDRINPAELGKPTEITNDENTPAAPSNSRRPFLHRAWGVVKKVGETLIPIDEKIPAEEIDDQSVAKAILERLGNPLQERMGGDRYANPFDITSVIVELGHIAPLKSTDYMKKYPQEYEKVRAVLRSLRQKGILEMRDVEEQNSHGERIYYKVINPDDLAKVAQGIELPQK